MKRTILLFLCLLWLAACVPTPEEDAVKQKDTNVLIDTVLTSQEEQQAQHPGATLPPVKTQVPERFVIDEVTETRGVHVTADVPIEVLTDTVFPLLRIEKAKLTDEQRLLIYKRLFQKDTLYRFEEHLSRESLVWWIEQLMQERDKEEWMREIGGTEEEWERVQERRRQQLKEYQDLYNALPADDSLIPLLSWDGSLPVGEQWMQWIVGDPYEQEGIYQLRHGTVFQKGNRVIDFEPPWLNTTFPLTASGFGPTWKNGVERIDPKDYDKPHAGATVTPNDVTARALSVLDGVADYVLADVYWANNGVLDGEGAGETGETAYLVELVPNCGDARMVYCEAMAIDHTDAYAEEWEYPHIVTAFSPDGAQWGFEWYSPQRITQTLSESTALLPFDEVRTLILQQINRIYSDEWNAGGTLKLTRVQLGLFRIREQNSMDGGLLVPVWYISSARFVPDPNAPGYRADRTFEPQEPLLILNAVDGSVIDPWKGY